MKALGRVRRGLAVAALGGWLALPMGAFSADIKGSIKFEGEKIGRTIIRMDADPKCAAMHDKQVGSENVLMRTNSRTDETFIQNVFVYIKEGADIQKADAQSEPAMIDQKGCMYTPRVQGMRAGQDLLIRNSDNTAHNIHSQATKNSAFNFAQPTPGDRTVVMRRAEMPVKFKCDVHPWMTGYVFVMDHDFFAVSSSTGRFTIENVPAGDYTLVAWHEELGTQEVKVTVGADEVTTQGFVFKVE